MGTCTSRMRARASRPARARLSNQSMDHSSVNRKMSVVLTDTLLLFGSLWLWRPGRSSTLLRCQESRYGFPARSSTHSRRNGTNARWAHGPWPGQAEVNYSYVLTDLESCLPSPRASHAGTLVDLVPSLRLQSWHTILLLFWP